MPRTILSEMFNAASRRSVTMIGVGDEGKPIKAEHSAKEVIFGSFLMDGKLAEVHAPLLSVATAAEWIHRRTASFEKAKEDSRESLEEAIRRKTIAAQGQEFGKKLREALDDMGKMEYDMMFSPDSHSAGVDLKEVRSNIHEVINVDSSGQVSNVDPSLRDNEGRLLSVVKGQ